MDDNAILIQKVNLKSFANEKELQKFLTNDDTDIKFAAYDYNSEACINLMKNARESGYWMGIVAINSTTDNLIVATYNRLKGQNIQFVIYLLAVVGDDTLYLVDPNDDTYYRIMAMAADFEDYYTPKVIRSKVN
jgi:hypothetical protein